MSAVSSFKTTRTRHTWSMPSPGHVRDVLDAWNMAAAQAKDLGINTDCDDWLNVEAWDDEIRFWFETETAK